MAIDRLPGVYYTERVDAEIDGNGAKIPVFIGVTDNTETEKHKVDGTQMLSYLNYDSALKPLEEGGIGMYDGENRLQPNPLLNRLEEFFEENHRKRAGELQVPKVYVIDCGDGKKFETWTNAISTAKSELNINLEVYILPNRVEEGGVKKLSHVLEAISKSLALHEYELILRTSIYDLGKSVGDADLINAVKDHRFTRVALAEPLQFGKTVARICCTPYYLEPGFLSYRSVNRGEFTSRTPKEELDLQNAGVIFNHDEKTGASIYPKINLAVFSTFGASPRPADSLFHTRCNADHLLNSIFNACYAQIKANETATNIVYLQSKVDKIIYDEVEKGYMKEYDGVKGTHVVLKEAENYPYEINLTGQIQPINSTIAIEVFTNIKGAL